MTLSPQPAAKRPKKERALLESIPTPSVTGTSKFTRALGSADPLTRKKAVTALQRWLELRNEVAAADLIVIWKGLFYCYWHSDLVPVQEELATQLASILQHVKPAVAYAYFSTCMATLRREWFGIDRHRIDKFLNFIREFVYQLFILLHSADWEEHLVAQYMGFLENDVLCPKDTLLAHGVAFQIADVWLSELARAVGPAQRVAGCVLSRLLQPFVFTLATSSHPATLRRTMSSVFETLAQQLVDGTQHVPEDEDVVMIDAAQSDPWGELHIPQLAQTLFDLGSHEATAHRNREALYHCSQLLTKAAKRRAKKSSCKASRSSTAGAVHTVHIAPVAVVEEEAAAEAPGTPPSTPPSATAAQKPPAVRSASQAAAKEGTHQPKSVRWNLQNNLFFAVDGPIPDQDVRTPPGAKPKGSALKRVSALPKPKKVVREGVKLSKKRRMVVL